MEYKLRWSKGLSGWQTSFGKFHIHLLESGLVHIYLSSSYSDFTCYPSFEAAAPTIKTLMFEDQIQKTDNLKRIYDKFR
jgi:hypothetical protein